jgi:hypothetical protein
MTFVRNAPANSMVLCTSEKEKERKGCDLIMAGGKGFGFLFE